MPAEVPVKNLQTSNKAARGSRKSRLKSLIRNQVGRECAKVGTIKSLECKKLGTK